MRRLQWACFFITLGAIAVRLGSIALVHSDVALPQLLVEYWIDYAISVAGLGSQAVLIKLSEK